MTNNLPDRPPALTRRGPRPAPDETVDPVHFVSKPVQDQSPVSTPDPDRQALPKVAKRKRELTFPFSTRLSQDVQETLDQAVESEGITVREAVEQAIRSRWGSRG